MAIRRQFDTETYEAIELDGCFRYLYDNKIPADIIEHERCTTIIIDAGDCEPEVVEYLKNKYGFMEEYE